jgi:hypothetical protein
MLVHRVATLEQLHEVVVADGQADGQTDGAPERITSTDPIPEAEHVVGMNAELGHFLFVGGKRDEMLSHG